MRDNYSEIIVSHKLSLKENAMNGEQCGVGRNPRELWYCGEQIVTPPVATNNGCTSMESIDLVIANVTSQKHYQFENWPNRKPFRGCL